MEYKPTKQKLKPRYFCFLNFDLDPVPFVLTLDPDIEGCICKYRMNFPFQLVQNLIHTHTHTHTHTNTHTHKQADVQRKIITCIDFLDCIIIILLLRYYLNCKPVNDRNGHSLQS